MLAYLTNQKKINDMKKILTFGAALAIVAGTFTITSCYDHHIEQWSNAQFAQAKYEKAFIARFGQPAKDQTWGFGTVATKGATRGINNPSVLEATQPYDDVWVENYLATATEVDNTNAWDKYDNGYQAEWRWYAIGGGKLSTLIYNYDYCTSNGVSQEEKNWYTNNIKTLVELCNKNFYGATAKEILDKLKGYSSDPDYDYKTYWGINVTSEGGWVADPTFVLNFKITGEWTGQINVIETSGITDGVKNGYARTVVVTGTWNLSWTEQKVGALGRIVVANGGTINVGDGATLKSVNEAQIVVLPGGKITGDGAIEFSNGTSTELQSYNGGTISVGKFNNNGGNFFNYGTLKATTMDGGAGNSRYYNHGIINIGQTGSSANLRIYNGCQFYCAGNMRLRNYEGTQGSSLICKGELMVSGSNDGTSDASYVGLQAGALVKCNTLNNNGASWSGPTTGGYAVLDIEDKITYLNWEQYAPQNGGYFANNLYVYAGTWNNTPDGNGGETAEKNFQNVMNATGNGNVTIIQKSTEDKDEIIPADPNFKEGESGCTPGFKGDTPDPTPQADVRVIAEDLSVSDNTDFDFNDVVFDVTFNYPAGKTTITLLAAGGTLPLYVGGQEVHEMFGVSTKTMVNTGAGASKEPVSFELDGTFNYNAKSIVVQVKKEGELAVITAERGKVASKIAVKPQYEWCKERQDIEEKHPAFGKYVKGEVGEDWWEIK